MKILLLVLLPLAVCASELSSAAALMQPRGFRAIINSTGLTEGMFRIGVKYEPIFPFANCGAWDPIREEMLFVGAPHQHPWEYSMPIYSASTNSWRSANLSPYLYPWGQFNTHAYDNISINPKTGDFFFYAGKFIKYRADTDSWTEIQAVNQGVFQANINGTTYAYNGLKYFPDINSLVYYNYGRVMILSLDSLKWRVLTTSLPMGDIEQEGAYDPVDHVLYFGGGGSLPRKLYKMDAALNITPIADAPRDVVVSTSLMACDPVTGALLLVKADSIFAYDYGTDKWSGAAKIPTSTFDPQCAAIIPVSTYGVIAFWTTCQYPILLYKHANPTATESAPQNISRRSGPLFRAAVYNCAGKKVRAFPGDIPASVRWDGRDSFGRVAPAGIYVMELKNEKGERFWEKTPLLK